MSSFIYIEMEIIIIRNCTNIPILASEFGCVNFESTNVIFDLVHGVPHDSLIISSRF